MTRRERITLQRQKAQEALGILKGVGELFGAEADYDDTTEADMKDWAEAILELEKYIFYSSPIA